MDKKEITIITLTDDNYQEEMQSLHSKAMDLAEDGFFLRRDGRIEDSKQKFFSAYRIEKSVADHLLESKRPVGELEPSRSTLALSVAALALDADLIEQANLYASKVVDLKFDKYYMLEALKIMEAITNKIKNNG